MQMMELEESISLEIQLLEVLKHESEWRTTEELSKLLNVSYKKTGTLIDNLIWKISRFNSEQIILKSVRGRGIILKIESIRAYNKFRREIQL